jgi:D-threo-aldose 1-dehydrogenase
MFEAHSDEHADAVLASAVAHGLRYFDTAPLYGHGLAEQRVGRAVARLPRDEVFVSTKVGRLLRANAPRDETQFYLGEPFYKDVPQVGPVWDFTYDGIMTSVEESYQRTGLDRFDVLLLHHPDDHLDVASTSAFRALAKLREDGTTRAIGAGANQASTLARLVEACVSLIRSGSDWEGNQRAVTATASGEPSRTVANSDSFVTMSWPMSRQIAVR